MNKVLKIIRNNIHRPPRLVLIKMMSSFMFKLYLKNQNFEKSFLKWMKKKEIYFNNYFNKHYKYILNTESTETNINSIDGKPIIFLFWYQGIEKAPELVRLAVHSIEKNAKNYDVILLDKNNFKDYVDINDSIEDKLKKNIISLQNFSDYLRVKLLEKYNCLWVDATLLALKEIPLFYSKLDFFSVNSPILYCGKKEYQLYPNFKFGQVYLLGGQYKRIFKQVRMFFEKYFEKHSVYLDYFMIYYFFNYLYLFDLEDKKVIDSIPVNNKHIEDFFYYRNTKFDSSMVDDTDVFAKLSYKQDYSKALKDKESTLSKIIKPYIE